MAPISSAVTRGLFGLAEHVAPKLAGRLAFELFCRTPNPKKASEREARALLQARRFMAEARHHRLTLTSGAGVVAHEFRPADGRRKAGTVLVVHGWRSRTEHMRTLIEGLRGAGFRVIALDLPGHGASPGRRLNMAIAVDAVRAAGEWFGPFAAAVGHSFGGAVALNAIVGSVKGVAPLDAGLRVLLSAPASKAAIF
jgi:alpha-beta hydrolase superfamily lysophospholipase